MSEYKQLTQEQVAMLNEPLPQEAIKPHPTKSYLSTINAVYVTERLNQVFGVGSWTTHLEHVTSQQSGKNIMVVTKTVLEIPEYGIHIECYGGNDNADLGDAFKGSTTDALTKIGSYLGIGAHVWKNQPNAYLNTKKNTGITEEEVIAKIKAAKTVDEMTKTYLSYPQYRGNEKLIAACRETKAKLEKK